MNDKELTHIDLFSGIGGFTLAGEWAGFRTIVFCEKEEFCQKVLKKRFGAITHADNRRQPRNLREAVSRGKEEAIPNSEFSSRNSGGSGIFRPLLIPEIRDFDGTEWRGTTLLTGGFPCQPFSVAGQRRGKEDDRYLWPEMRRVISEAKPPWILAENVPGIFRMALDTVLADLEGEGYTVGTFIIPACSLNAPHRRNRVWIIANSRCQHGEGTENRGKFKRPIFEEKNASLFERPIKDDESRDAQDAIGTRTGNQSRKIDDQERQISQDRREGIRQKDGTISSGGIATANKYASDSESRMSREQTEQERRESSGGRNIETIADPKRILSQGLNEGQGQGEPGRSCWEQDWYEIATRFCRMDDGVPDRIHRLKALGNAIVPQIAYEILKNIAWIENELAR